MVLADTSYLEAIGGVQHVMIGYSDSSKDAGTLAAAWAQYRAQDELSKIAKNYGVKLVYFMVAAELWAVAGGQPIKRS